MTSNLNAQALTAADNSKLDVTGKTVFDDIYTAPDPRPYCETMQALDYVIPTYAQAMFTELFQAYRQHTEQDTVRVLDLGSSYGINAALLRYNYSLSELYQRYTSTNAQTLSSSELLQRDRRDFHQRPKQKMLEMVGFDVSAPALQYALQAGLIADAVAANLETDEVTAKQAEQLAKIDCVISSGCMGYVTTTTLEKILNVSETQLPWMGHCVLRMFSLRKLTSVLEARGYQITLHPQPVKQRRFASPEEQAQVISRLLTLGVDPTGLEDQGWLYAWLMTATPSSDPHVTGLSLKT